MGAEYETLCEIKQVVDFDTGMYHSGEIDGLFQQESLEDYLKKYGAGELIAHLAFLTYQVISMNKKVAQESQDQAVSATPRSQL